MRNILIIFTFFAFAAGILFFTGTIETLIAEQKKNNETPISSSGSEENTPAEEEMTEEPDAVRTKIELIKKRLADKGMILEGDSYYNNNQLSLALKKYLEFYKKNPNDPLILEKIALTYFELKKFGSSVNYLSRLPEMPQSQKELFALSLIYSLDITLPENRVKIENELKKYNYSSEEIFYYTQSLSCVVDFHMCKLWFQDSFSGSSVQKSGTWTQNTVFSPLLKVEEALKNYENFQLEDVSLKNAYLIGAWYHNKLYPVTVALSKELLKEKPGYKPVLKILAQSYYELGEYIQAREVLTQYQKIDSQDADVSYMLGVIHEKLKDYVVANIHLNKALELGYTPSIDVRRQLIHNLYLLENDAGMLKAFWDLVEEEENLEASDLGLAVYYHIIHESYEIAQKWSKKGQELFPENGDFYAYEGWILRENGNTQEAFSLLQHALSKDPKNPFLLIQIAYTAKESGNQGIAQVYFKKVLQEAPNTLWSTQAQMELSSLETE